jgi:hypothetical protein
MDSHLPPADDSSPSQHNPPQQPYYIPAVIPAEIPSQPQSPGNRQARLLAVAALLLEPVLFIPVINKIGLLTMIASFTLAFLGYRRGAKTLGLIALILAIAEILIFILGVILILRDPSLLKSGGLLYPLSIFLF